jgi:hypothetical protein
VSYRGLAVILFRCSGAISVVVGIFQFAAYVPMVWDVSPSVHGGPGVLRTVLLPSLASIVGGVVLLLLANMLGRLVARGIE